MLTLDKITKGFGPQTVFKEVSLVIGAKERVGVVGVNGAGKSTLVKIMGGQLDPDKGVVDTHASSVGYLSQESQCRLGVTVAEEMRSALPGVADVEARLLKASESMADGQASKSDLADLAKAADDLHRLEAHTLDARIGRVLSGLGFELDAVDRLTDTYSGGWQMRIAMAKLLLQEPDYLLLDEPTNHLDITARYWLMYEYIPSYPGSVVVISHEPEFLNVVCERVIEVEDQTIKEYKGNYDDYERLKEEAYQRQLKEWEAQQKELEKTREFIDRFKGNKSKAGMAESRQKMIDKLEILEKPKAKGRTIYLEFPEAPRSSVEPVIIKNVSKKYGDKVIWDDVSLTLVRGDKVALVGPNGIGKSTLLKMIVNDEKPTKGNIDVNPKTVIGYFAQHQAEALNNELTVMEETMAGIDPKLLETARGLLARLQFRGEDAPFKKVKVLSGGERSRVALATFLLRPANLYLLDEPTNHLDLNSRQVLQDALVKFDGTILMASHDRELIDAAATGEYEVENGKLVLVRDPAAARD
ncbi:MAG: ABC-F family ATP-binding cassette domain-containing protein [Cytophagales bacterium]|nr:ABC-F family ATP-binding cassette domain-containing protein [Armatimonadota bacterium]